MKKIIRRFLKIFLWLVAGVIFLFLVVALLVNVPSIQNYIVNKITTSISSKTNSTVRIGRVGISFPKSIFIKDVFLDDQKKDTLLYAGEISVDVDMIALLKSNISINRISIDDLSANIKRMENDSLFNFSFIINSFAKKDDSKVEEKKDSSTTKLMVSAIELNNVHLKYDDRYKGIISMADFDKLEIKADEMDLQKMNFDIDDFIFSNAKIALAITKNNGSTVSDTSSQPLAVKVSSLKLEKIDFGFRNDVDGQSISFSTQNLKLKESNINLSTNQFDVDKIESIRTKFSLMAGKSTDRPAADTNNASNPFNVKVNEIKLTESSFAFDNPSERKTSKSFDPNHLHISNLDLVASNTAYSSEKSTSTIEELSFEESNGFTLKNLSSEILFSQKEIHLDNLSLETSRSKIKSDLQLNYSSLNALKDSLQNVLVGIDLKRTTVDPRDVLYFAPQLSAIPFLKNQMSMIAIDGKINGKIKDIQIKDLDIRAGSTTHLITSARITGLPNTNNAYFNVGSLTFNTTSKDILDNTKAGTIPSGIQLPDTINLTGNFKGTLKQFDSELALRSSTGNITASVKMDGGETYNAVVNMVDFNAGKLLNQQKSIGKISSNITVKGTGLTKETANADINIKISSAELNQYHYENLNLSGKISDQQFDGNISLNDSNLQFAFNGIVGFKQGSEKYKFTLDIEGANLQNLNLSKDDIRIAAKTEVNITGNNFDNINGKAGITKFILVKDGKTYTLDSLLFASVNGKDKSEMSFSSALVGIKFNGSIAPGNLANEITNHINQYYVVSDTVHSNGKKNNFTFEITMHNHPLLSEVFLPSLTEFEPGVIKGSFDATKNSLEINANIFKLTYDGLHIDNALFKMTSDASKLNYSLHASELSSGIVMLDNLNAVGELKNNTGSLNFSVGKDESNKKLSLDAEISSPQKNEFKIHFIKNIILGGDAWNLPAGNEILISKNNPAQINFAITKGSESVSVKSGEHSSTEIAFKDFQLINLSHIIEKDTALVEGNLNGTFNLLERGAFNSTLTLNDLKLRSRPVGDLKVSAKISEAAVVDVDIKLSGNENDLSLTGTVSQNENDNSSKLNLKLAIRNINMQSIEGFSFGQLQNSSGNITGDIQCHGSFAQPKLEGKLHLINVVTTPVSINNKLTFSNETVSFTNSEIQFDDFTIRDINNHTAKISGSIVTTDLQKPSFKLTLVTDHFLAINSTAKSNELYYGTLIIDSKIRVSGTPSFPKINADIKLDDGSYFTFAVPESRLSADKGEGVIEFSNGKLNTILTKNGKKENQKSDFKNLSISSSIRVDKNAALKLLIDPVTGDSLLVKGNAALSFTLDPGGKISLTGRYELAEGSYLVSLQDLVKKQFEIQKGSTITWNGDPLDADINMRAICTIRTSPIDLMSNQLGTMTATEQNQYKERLSFQVILKLTGELLKPNISFEIQLPPEDRGALGGAVTAKLNMLNADESELNKQVFALLVLNRFIQEDPLASAEGRNSAEGVARSSVSRFLSQQLNQFSSKYIGGVELNFDVQSFDDPTRQNQGRTQVEVALKKQFSDRFSVQVGDNIDVEGESTKQNTLSDLTGDILIEYKLTDDGRYRLKGFRQNDYEGIFEGQLTETGAGIVYTRDFDKWKDLFKKPVTP